MNPRVQEVVVVDPMFVSRSRPRRPTEYVSRPSHYVSAAAARPAGSRQFAARPEIVPAPPLPSISAGRKMPPPVPVVSGPPPVPADSAVRPVVRRVPGFSRRIPNRQTAVLYGMAAVIFTVGLLVSLNGLRANRQVAAQVKHAQAKAIATVSDDTTPSTVRPTPAQIAGYSVSPNIPRYIDIPALGVHARVMSEGVTRSSQLQVPWNIYDAGWYNASSQPGQNGAVLIDGHSGIGAMHGVFYKIGTLKPGDPITITRGDGQRFTYKVVQVHVENVASVNMNDLLVSKNTARPGLNLITCAGERIPGTEELNERAEVFAVME